MNTPLVCTCHGLRFTDCPRYSPQSVESCSEPLPEPVRSYGRCEKNAALHLETPDCQMWQPEPSRGSLGAGEQLVYGNHCPVCDTTLAIPEATQPQPSAEELRRTLEWVRRYAIEKKLPALQIKVEHALSAGGQKGGERG